jgi:hypothetical protein
VYSRSGNWGGDCAVSPRGDPSTPLNQLEPWFVDELARSVRTDPIATADVRRKMAREGLTHPFLHRVMDARLQRQLPHLLPGKRQASSSSNLWRLASFPLKTSQIHISAEPDDFSRCPYRADHTILHERVEIERLVDHLSTDIRRLRQLQRLAPDYLENPGLQLPEDGMIPGRLLEVFAAGKLFAVECRLTVHSSPGEIADESRKPREMPFPLSDRVSKREVQQVKTWIGIELYDEDTGAPIPNERYRLVLPDGSTQEGNLDENGRAEVDEIDFGVCKVTFPDIHAKEWHPA